MYGIIKVILPISDTLVESSPLPHIPDVSWNASTCHGIVGLPNN